MSLGDFFAMNGYGVYVWGSYGVVLLIFIIEVAMVRHRKVSAVQQLRLLRDAGNEE